MNSDEDERGGVQSRWPAELTGRDPGGPAGGSRRPFTHTLFLGIRCVRSNAIPLPPSVHHTFVCSSITWIKITSVALSTGSLGHPCELQAQQRQGGGSIWLPEALRTQGPWGVGTDPETAVWGDGARPRQEVLEGAPAEPGDGGVGKLLLVAVGRMSTSPCLPSA